MVKRVAKSSRLEDVFFRHMVANMHNGVLAIDREGGMVLINDEARIGAKEKAIKDVEQTMAAPDFYADHEKSKPVLAQHQALMWEVGELLAQWEMLQGEAEQYADLRNS